MTNLFRTMRTKFHQHRPGLVEGMTKTFWCVFCSSQCTCSHDLTAVVYCRYSCWQWFLCPCFIWRLFRHRRQPGMYSYTMREQVSALFIALMFIGTIKKSYQLFPYHVTKYFFLTRPLLACLPLVLHSPWTSTMQKKPEIIMVWKYLTPDVSSDISMHCAVVAKATLSSCRKNCSTNTDTV